MNLVIYSPLPASYTFRSVFCLEDRRGGEKITGGRRFSGSPGPGDGGDGGTAPKDSLLGVGSVRSLSKLVVGVGGGGPDSSNLSCTGDDIMVGGDVIGCNVDWTGGTGECE